MIRMESEEEGEIAKQNSRWEQGRTFLRRIVNHWLFGSFIMSVILLNALLYALADYTHVNDQGDLQSEGSLINLIIEKVDVIFMVVFLVEMVLKMLALGIDFRFADTYFRDVWNCLDFCIVIIGLVSLAPNVPNSTIIRTLRCVRPQNPPLSDPPRSTLTHPP